MRYCSLVATYRGIVVAYFYRNIPEYIADALFPTIIVASPFVVEYFVEA